jgi:hypothetical protein
VLIFFYRNEAANRFVDLVDVLAVLVERFHSARRIGVDLSFPV